MLFIFIGASVYAQINNKKKNKPALKSLLKNFKIFKGINDVGIIEQDNKETENLV
jgi:hypothetical protein